MNKALSLALHGGSGTILRKNLTGDKEQQYRDALRHALDSGVELLEKGSSALDAVESVVEMLENSPLFNAGKGSVFTADGLHEMDASIMDGSDLKAGAVAMVRGVKNPIKLARAVMDYSDHVFLAGEGAEDFAKIHDLEMESPDYFHDEYRHKQWLSVKDSNRSQLDHTPLNEDKFGTVGAVALDKNGNVAAATSTGGMTNKKFGRIGDSPMIGAGTYANNTTCAVSCTGSGEFFIRGVTAYDVSCLMEYKGLSLEDACNTVIHERMIRLGGDGGLIAVDANGHIAMPFNTEGMYRGYFQNGESSIMIFR